MHMKQNICKRLRRSRERNRVKEANRNMDKMCEALNLENN